MPYRTILVVDDEPNITFSLKRSLETSTLQVLTAASGREAIEIVRKKSPDAILMDVRLPDISGLEAYDHIRQIDSRLPVVIMTAFARTETAIEATRRGAFDYLIKPVDLGKLRTIMNRAVEVSRLGKVPALLSAPEDTDSEEADVIVGVSAPMQEVYKTIGRVAALDSTVLILGESGTGKELVARAIYHYSSRKDKPFLAINCAALSESLLESELFGHERGAFTGADQRRIGKFEQVNGGTILLDEIGDMSAATQSKALRLLQQQQFERVGGNVTIQTDVRVIAATNRDMVSMVDAGSFRRDLYYRLNVFAIHLPPLRERLEDIPLLATNFIRRMARDLGHAPLVIMDDTIETLQKHHWPGNVRELESAMKFALVHSTSDVITPNCLPESCRFRAKPQTSVQISLHSMNAAPHQTEESIQADRMDGHLDIAALTKQLLSTGTHNLYREVGSAVDKVVLEMVMQHVSGNQQQAAELLGISRMTLRTKLRALLSDGEHGSKDPL